MGLVNSTIYQVQTVMSTKDESSLVFGAIERSAGAATRAVDEVKRGLGLIGVGLGFIEAKKGLIDFNASLEDARVTMAGMLTMFTGAPLESAWDRAGQSVDTFNKMAAKSSLTTKDLVDMATLIERPLLQAGVRMKDIEKITFGVANASRAFHISAPVAATDIQQALSAGVHIRDSFAIALLAQKTVNLTKEQFNALNIQKKIDVLTKATTSGAVTEMAKKQGEATFTGVVSTLKDNLSLMFGRVGLDVFHKITQEVSSLNKWMDKNSVEIARFEKTLSEGVVTGFKYVKSVVEFLVSHADTLITIGKVWAVGKVGGMLGGAFGFGRGGGAGGAAGSGMSAISNAFTSSKMISEAMQTAMLHIRFPLGKVDLQPLFQKLSALGGAAGALGPAGVLGIGYAAHELGEYLGVHRALTAAIDPARLKLEDLKKSMDMFDEQVRRTAKDLEAQEKDGALGTKSATNALGAVDFYKMQLNVLEDIRAKRYPGADTAAWKVEQLKKLESAGFDQDERKNLLGHAYARAGMIGDLKEKITGVASRTYLSAHETDKGIELAMKLMTPAQRANIDMNKATQMVMEKFMQLFSSSGYGMTGLNAALMAPEEIKKLLLRDAVDPFKGAAVNQNITNHISVEVSAKDPDRWLMEVDEKVQRKIRAPSQARGSVITRGGM